ncbi:hypothetical protein CIPAW_04G069200 [Carya illinoinensis]|uniref:Uncharacterized protein n=1 Tax=Carya illinoinensis TaxID=32201 RepID=A0A8T1QRB1_CARIL|nr:hypothetical protein CIPAW_04G069200 [Carya illinoinensis]
MTSNLWRFPLTSLHLEQNITVVLRSFIPNRMPKERSLFAKLKEGQSRKTWEARLQGVQDEEAIEQKLCHEDRLIQSMYISASWVVAR